MSKNYEAFKATMEKLKDIEAAISVMNWDMEIYMPKKSGSARSSQLATLSAIYHETLTDESFGNILSELLEEELTLDQKKNVIKVKKQYDKELKFSTAFVKRRSKLISAAFQSWDEAKKNNDFSLYAPHLQALIELKREEAKIIGYKDHPYDALIDQYEPGMTTKAIDDLFDQVRVKLVPFVKTLLEKEPLDNQVFFKHYEHQNQWDFGIFLLKQMGYNMDMGRQDISSHPFTISFSPEDVRVTTRVKENDLSEMIWSCIHEGGHALYEQGLNMAYYGLPQGEAISLGIHESQSRLYENNVGRSEAYWNYNFPILQDVFPEQLNNVTSKDFYKAMNRVESNLIRTNADELTYHFHIMIRFEIEKMLIEGTLEVKDLPKVWNEKYKSYLNIDVPNDTEGVLQDIHWAHGGIGYFPTYSLGSFYAAQFYKQAEKEIPNLKNQLENGELLPLKEWLNENIHNLGGIYTSEELCEKVTGKRLDFNGFYEYAVEKYSALYTLEILESNI